MDTKGLGSWKETGGEEIMFSFVIYLLGVFSGFAIACLSLVFNGGCDDTDKAYENGFNDGRKVGRTEK